MKLKLFKVCILLVVSIIFLQSNVLATESDPYAIQATLTKDGSGGLGSSVAICGDGSRMIVSEGDGNDKVYIFDRPGSGNWTGATPVEVALEGGNPLSWGRSVAISFDGSTVAITGIDDDEFSNVWVMQLTGVVWTEKAKLHPAGAETSMNNFSFSSVSISDYGSTVVAGASEDPSNAGGAVYVFEKPAEGWANSDQNLPLHVDNSQGLGQTVAISRDGSTVVAGAWGAAAAAYVFTKSGSSWSSPSSAKLTYVTQGTADFYAVAINSNGSTVAVSAPDEGAAGTVYLFERPGNGWSNTSNHIAKLTASDLANGSLGYSLAINSNGSRVAAGAYFANVSGASKAGATYVFTKPDGGWVSSVVPSKLYYDPTLDGNFGTSTAISADGLTVATGEPGRSSDAGAVYVFKSSETPTPEPTPGPVPVPPPDPSPCSLSISTFNPSVTGNAGTTTYGVSNATGYTNVSWTATVQHGGNWFTITSGASGTDSGTITCAFTANPSTVVARTAYIGIVPSDGSCQGRLGIMVTQNPLSASATLLWTNTYGAASVWSMDAPGNLMSSKTYGPFTGWTADSFHREAVSEGNAQMLWNHIDGTASVQFMNDMGDMINMEYGPEAGWTAVRYHLNSNGTSQMLWDHTDGTASVWTLDVRGNITSRILYGPYTDSIGTWIATDYQQNSDGTANMLWVRTDAYTSVWTLDISGNMTSRIYYGPYKDETGTYLWYAQSYLRNSDGTANMLWSRNGHASVWTLNSSGNMTSRIHYGPNLGWIPQNFDKIR
jgi:hypothetical protein